VTLGGLGLSLSSSGFLVREAQASRGCRRGLGDARGDGCGRGGYTPDLIVVEHGRPVRLTFRREETASCSEMVLLPDFHKSATLPQGEVVPIEFLPKNRGG
jgi:hypothetical protein